MLIVLILFAALAGYVALVFYVNRNTRVHSGDIAQSKGAALPKAGNTLSVLTWNIGYAALGKDADFVIDNGRSFRALSKPSIAAAADNIAAWLAARPADVICLQENANPGFLTRQVPVRATIEAALNGCRHMYWSDMKSVCVPRFLQLDHGMSVHARLDVQSCTTLDMPQDDTYHFGLIKKHYGGLVTRLPRAETGQDWVVINLHLSAFDEKGLARLRQLKALMAFAQAQYAAGHLVVIGGDWNMRLAATAFAHDAKQDDLAWASDFPQDILPEGWKMAVDPSTPTVRSLDNPYVAGRNYTTILDGFMYAPNVSLVEVAAADLAFAYSDHQPVEARFEAREDTPL